LSGGDIWEKDVQYLKNVGPKRVGLLRKMGISTIGDLLYYFPRDYDDRSRLMPARAYQNGQQATVRGVVTGGEEKRPRKGLTITRIFIHDGTDLAVAVWYNQPFIRHRIPVGTRLLVTGKIHLFHAELQVQVADYEVEDGGDMINTGRIVPIYPLTEGLSQRLVRSMIKTALDQWGDCIEEFIPPAITVRYVLPELRTTLNWVHFPGSREELGMARRRLIFEELLIHQVMVAVARKICRQKQKKHSYPSGDHLEREFIARLPFTITPGQGQAWEEIKKDMQYPYPMNRLLQGDVGAGKTVVCALAMIRAVSGGFQAALMAPTEILAGQHYINIKEYFNQMGISVALITGGMKKKQRENLLAGIKTGEVQVVVGTHAVIQGDVQFKNLALAVIDEQHRFGVRQRALLRQKGQSPDVLVMTATPIPRTLAMTIYGDLDISSIRGLPPGRKPVETYVCARSQAGYVYGAIKKEVSRGRQAYIVCPLVEESEKTDLQAAVELKELLAGGALNGCRVDLLHGRMKAEDKEDIMSRFRHGLVDVLVSTTVIEVGVDVPNATMMTVVDAHRFGLAQLHQLRGRVGRGGHSSRCYLISDARGDEAAARLEAMRTISDGFVLSEKDLDLRGPGELFGTRQSGEILYRIADPVRDIRALEVAAREARQLVERDPGLRSPENRALAGEINNRYKGFGFLAIG